MTDFPTVFADGQNWLRGEDADPHFPVDTAVWSRLYDPETKKKTGRLLLRRYYTVREVYNELHKQLDLIVCPACGWERKRKPRDCCEPCKNCLVETFWWLDEYMRLHGDTPGQGDYADQPCGPYLQLLCFPVTGGNEGHYVDIGAMYEEPVNDGYRTRMVYRSWAGIKTFRGMDHAFAMCRKIVGLLEI